MPITTVEACKAFRDIPTDNTEHDSELERLIAVVQRFLETECGRQFDDSGASAPLTEYVSGSDYKGQVLVARPPILSITDIQIDNTRLWTQAPLDASLYAIYDAEAGIIKLINYKLPDGVLNVRVRYRGGFAVMPKDLEQAAIELVWSVRMKGEQSLIGVRSRGMADGSVQYVNLDWPMNLGPIISHYSLRTGIA